MQYAVRVSSKDAMRGSLAALHHHQRKLTDSQRPRKKMKIYTFCLPFISASKFKSCRVRVRPAPSLVKITVSLPSPEVGLARACAMLCASNMQHNDNPSRKSPINVRTARFRRVALNRPSMGGIMGCPRASGSCVTNVPCARVAEICRNRKNVGFRSL